VGRFALARSSCRPYKMASAFAGKKSSAFTINIRTESGRIDLSLNFL